MTTTTRDLVVVGASAGGVETLRELAAGLPADFDAALLVVLHLPSDSASALPRILNRAGPLSAEHAVDGAPLRPGTITVAPPGHHLLVGRSTTRVVRGPAENGHRPAVDPLFRGAARWHGPRAVGVVLSGVLDDGTAGLYALKARGGLAVVQDPDDALYDGMPRNAMAAVRVDAVLPVSAIPGYLVEAVTAKIEVDDEPPPEELVWESEMSDMSPEEPVADPLRTPSPWTCPDCHGTLWEIGEEGPLRFRCRTGHAWSADSLFDGQKEQVEAALWVALRALEEQSHLAARLAQRAERRFGERSYERFRRRVEDLDERARVIREVLSAGDLAPVAIEGPMDAQA